MSRPFRIGMQSAFSARPLMAPFDFALDHGFEAFEWFPDHRADGEGWVIADLGHTDRLRVRNRARDAGVHLSVHAPVYIDLFRPETAVDLDDSLLLAVDLGADLVNLHFGHADRVEDFARTLIPVVDRFSVAGVRLALENVPSTPPEAFNRLFSLLPAEAGVGMCLDVGHANLYPQTHNNYLAYLDRLDPRVPIVCVDLHENHGDRDSHLLLFTGPAKDDPSGLVGLFERLARRRFQGDVILDQWPTPPGRLVEVRDRLLGLLGGHPS